MRPESLSSPFHGQAAWLLVLATLLLSAAFAYFQGDYPCDDTYIHLRYVKNLVEHHQFAYNLDEPTYSTTSPLWNVIVALPAAALGTERIDYLWQARIVAFICMLLAAAALLVYTRVAHGSWILVVPVLFVLDPYVTSIVNTAMEKCLFILLGVLSLVCLHLTLTRARGYGVAAAAFSALQMATRPEGLVFAVGTVLFLAYRRRFADLLLYAFSVLLFVSPFLIYVQTHFGSIVPQTMLVKTTDQHGRLPFSDLRTLRAFLKLALQVYGVPVALVVGLHLRYARERFASGRDDRALLLFIVISLFLAYAGLLKEKFISSRYLVNFTPLLLILLVLWIRDIPARRIRTFAFAAIVGYFVVLNVLSIPVRVQRGLRDGPALKEVGEWVRDNVPVDATVLMANIGYVGFYSERRVRDFNLLEKTEGSENRGVLHRKGQLTPVEQIYESGIDYVIRGNCPEGFHWAMVYETRNLLRGFPLRVYKVN